MAHTQSQEGKFFRRGGKRRTPKKVNAPQEIYVAVDEYGNLHDSSKHKDAIDTQIAFMKKTFKVVLSCVTYTRKD